MTKASLLWMDLEMTGLDPIKDRIMEVACIATDWKLRPVAEFAAVIKVSDELIKTRMVGDFWKNNPESYQALISQNPTGKSATTVERELLDFINQYFKKDVYLAGNSIHQDRKFIDHEWPKLSKRLHYRMLDVSAWKVFFENLFHRYFTKPEAHRALDDIHGSIEEFSFYLGYITPELRKKYLPKVKSSPISQKPSKKEVAPEISSKKESNAR